MKVNGKVDRKLEFKAINFHCKNYFKHISFNFLYFSLVLVLGMWKEKVETPFIAHINEMKWIA